MEIEDMWGLLVRLFSEFVSLRFIKIILNIKYEIVEEFSVNFWLLYIYIYKNI